MPKIIEKSITKAISFALIFTFIISLTTSCANNQNGENDGRLQVVATTTMLYDLVKNIGGDKINAIGLMSSGIDPHSYKPTARNITRLQTADIVVINGLHLEGKMAKAFENLGRIDKTVVSLEHALDKSKLIELEGGIYDPHIWFDVSLWKDSACIIEKALSEKDSENSAIYAKNLENYLSELDELDTYIKERVESLDENSRVLVTAHDAFGYFSRAYGFEVKGIQGINTQAEAGTYDVDKLAQFIADKKIKAIFVESSVSSRTIEALKASVKAKNHDVSIGGELYSDTLGDEQSDTETYIKTYRKNIDTIVDGLSNNRD